MVYIRSEANKRVSINEFHYTTTMIVIVYRVYRKLGSEIQELDKDKFIVRDNAVINNLLNQDCNVLSAFDCVCKNVLRYMIENEMFQGTIEVENG